jgi:hypothetical protein
MPMPIEVNAHLTECEKTDNYITDHGKWCVITLRGRGGVCNCNVYCTYDQLASIGDLISVHLHAKAHPGPNGETAEQLSVGG